MAIGGSALLWTRTPCAAVDPLRNRMCRFQGGIRMSFKPVIGINGEFRAAKKDVIPLSWFNTGYYDSVATAGGLPALAPSLA